MRAGPSPNVLRLVLSFGSVSNATHGNHIVRHARNGQILKLADLITLQQNCETAIRFDVTSRRLRFKYDSLPETERESSEHVFARERRTKSD